jgi:hypothetical protein
METQQTSVIDSQSTQSEAPKVEANVSEKKQSPAQEANEYLRNNLHKAVSVVAQWKGSKKQLQKVMSEWLQFPLADELPSWSYPEQKELFDLGNTLNNAKLILFYTALREKELAEAAKEMQNVAQEAINETGAEIPKTEKE